MLAGFSLSLYKLPTQISVVSSKEIFANKESTSRLAMCKLESCRHFFFAKWNESMAVYSLAVKGVRNFCKYFANL